MATPDIQKHARIREVVSTIFNSAKSAKHGDNPATVSGIARSSIDEKFEAGSEDHSLAMFFLNQIDQRNQPVVPVSSEQPNDQFEFWNFVHDDEKLGDKIKLIRLLGHGATSEVWLAESRQSRRSIAIKLVNSEGFSEKIRVSLVIEELQNLFRITHPNIVEIYSAGKLRNQNGVEAPFVIMEYIEGEPLDKWVANRAMPLTLREAVSIVVIIARALQFLHEGAPKIGSPPQLLEPIYHSDLKPQNIMMTSSGPKLIDFGSLTHAPSLGQIGTRPYVAPPRILPGATPNPQWDLFSLGGVLYFLVTGSHPLDTDRATLKESDWNNWIRSVNFGNDDLNRIFRKCMAYNAADEYESASDFAEDLEAWLESRPLPHVRRGTYKRWEKERLLLRRARLYDNIVDQSQIVGRMCLVTVGIVLCMCIIYSVLFATGTSPHIAIEIAGGTATWLAVGLILLAATLVRFKKKSLAIFEPVVAALIAFEMIRHIVEPSTGFLPTSWTEQGRSLSILLFFFAVVNVSYAAGSFQWRAARPIGWTVLVIACFFMPISESAYGPYVSVWILGAVEAACCLNIARYLLKSPQSS